MGVEKLSETLYNWCGKFLKNFFESFIRRSKKRVHKFQNFFGPL